MTSWDIEKARVLVEQIFGVAQVELVRPCFNSLAERQAYASYHFHEHKSILERHIDSHLGTKDILELTLPLHTADQWRIDNALTQAAAHVTACLQNLHCLLDTLAHAVCYCMGLNIGFNALTERAIGAHSVKQALKDKPEFTDVLRPFDEIGTHPMIKHLAALVNHSKHRSVIRPVLNVDVSAPRTQKYELEFPAFTYNGKQFPAVNVEKFLEKAYEVLSPKVVECGNALNVALEQRITPLTTA
jgi:hypothetical protein